MGMKKKDNATANYSMIIIVAGLVLALGCNISASMVFQPIIGKMLTTFDFDPATVDDKKNDKAIVYDYGVNFLRNDDTHPRPKPKKNQILVQVVSSSINPVDSKLRSAPFNIPK